MSILPERYGNQLKLDLTLFLFANAIAAGVRFFGYAQNDIHALRIVDVGLFVDIYKNDLGLANAARGDENGPWSQAKGFWRCETRHYETVRWQQQRYCPAAAVASAIMASVVAVASGGVITSKSSTSNTRSEFGGMAGSRPTSP